MCTFFSTPQIAPEEYFNVLGSAWQNNWRERISNIETFRTYFEAENADVYQMHDCLMALPLPLQKEILDDMLGSFYHPLVNKIFLNNATVFLDVPLSLYILLALMARHQLLENMSVGHDQNPFASFLEYYDALPQESNQKIQFANIATTLELAEDSTQFQLIKDIILERVKISSNYKPEFSETQLIRCFSRLPFPLNIKCLSEALNQGTNWKVLLDGVEELPALDDLREGSLHIDIHSKLIDSLVAARRGNLWNNKIALEIRVIINRQDLIKHAPKIQRLLSERELSLASRDWVQEEDAKKVVIDFINAIPTEERRVYINQAYQQGTPLHEFLNTRRLTCAERMIRWCMPCFFPATQRGVPTLPRIQQQVLEAETEPNTIHSASSNDIN